MDNQAVARELVRIAKQLEGDMGYVDYTSDPEVVDVFNTIKSKTRPTSADKGVATLYYKESDDLSEAVTLLEKLGFRKKKRDRSGVLYVRKDGLWAKRKIDTYGGGSLSIRS